MGRILPAIFVNAPYRVGPLETVTFTDDSPLYSLMGSTASLVIEGTVSAGQSPNSTAAGIVGISVNFNTSVAPGSSVTIETSGTYHIYSSAPGSYATGYSAGYFAPDFYNKGDVYIQAAFSAVGASGSSARHTLVSNSGTFDVTGNYAVGVDMRYAGDVANTGVLAVAGHTFTVGVYMDPGSDAANFTNSGWIRAADDTSDVDSVAVYWGTAYNAAGSFTNSGTLEGDYALKLFPYSGSPRLDLFTNTGIMQGNVDMGDGASKLVNSGTITGTVALGAGDDVYDGSSGTLRAALSAGDGDDFVTGGASVESLAGDAGADTILAGAGADTISGGPGANYLRGNEGDDVITGGADFDDIQGNTGNDTEHGGAGGDWVVGGQNNDRLFGDEGGDILNGNLGDDVCSGGDGADTVRGGQGDDTIEGGAGDDWLSGDRGTDQIAGGAGADSFHLFSGSDMDWVSDFNAAEGDRVVLDPGTQYVTYQFGADTVIDVAGGRMMLIGVNLATLPAGWIVSA